MSLTSRTPRMLAPLYWLLIPVLSSTTAADILRFHETGTQPSDRELSNERADSEQAQGIAFDGGHWFYSNKWNIYRLTSDFRNSNRKFKATEHSFSGVTCSHVGGIDYYDNEIFAALDNCSDDEARVLVLDRNLNFKRAATMPALDGSFPWVAVNPADADFLYTVSKDKRRLLAFTRVFANDQTIHPRKSIAFQDHPDDKLDHFWKQGGAFSANGLFFRVVDDAKDEDSKHTGVWVYEIDRPVTNGTKARRIGFINIRYDPDTWVPFVCGFDQCKRNNELEDIDARVVHNGPTKGDIHVLMLSNEAGEDDVSVYHYAVGDLDGDGIKDSLDNCLRVANQVQADLDRNGVGLACDNREIGSILVPVTCPALL